MSPPRNIHAVSIVSVPRVLSRTGWFLPSMLMLFLAHLIVGSLQDLALFYDEAYYYFWSESPAWGYYSKPPLVAWLIAVTTGLFGHQEWAVRLSSPFLYAGAAWFVYHTAWRLYASASIARWAALIFFSSPLVTFNSLFITTDAPLLFFWSLAIYCWVRASSEQQWHWWLALGLSLGLGLLSKYTMLVLLLSLIGYTLALPDVRRWWRQPGVWLSLAVTLLIFSPNLWWNAQQQFISFRHTSEISKLQHSLVHPGHLAEFFASQFFTFGPVAMGVLCVLIFRQLTSPASRLLMWTSLPMLGLILIQAFLAKANMNWAAPAYVGASILVAVWLNKRGAVRLKPALVAVNLLLAGVFYGYPQLQQLAGITPTEKNTPYQRISGWRELAARVPVLQSGESYLSDSRAVLSYLAYYAHNEGQPPPLLSFNKNRHIDDHYDLLYALDRQPNAGGYLFVSETPRNFQGCFTQVTPLPAITYSVYPTLIRTWHLYRLQGFNGYENCH